MLGIFVGLCSTWCDPAGAATVRTHMASVKDLDRIGMTGFKTFLYTLTMPFAGAALIYGLFNVGMTLAIGRSPKPQEWGALAIGAVAIPLVLWMKRGAGAFARKLASDPARVATLKLLTNKATGTGLGRTVGYAWLVDATGGLYASLIINNVKDFQIVREVVAATAPHAKVVEATTVTHVHA
jgi:hypothetical protein